MQYYRNHHRNPLIFIIDDAEWHNILLKKVLEAKGFRVVPFNDAEILLERLEIDQPDIIISDIDMPEFNGFQLYDEVRKREGGKNIPIIFLSSSDSGNVKEQARRAGAYAYIPKPLEQDDLDDVLGEWQETDRETEGESHFKTEAG